MEFFDVNVPYHEKDTIATTTAAADKDNAAKKAARLKVAVKAMELGYTGVANISNFTRERDTTCSRWGFKSCGVSARLNDPRYSLLSSSSP